MLSFIEQQFKAKCAVCVCDPNPSVQEEGAGGPEIKTSLRCVVKICARAGKVRVRGSV